MVLNFKDEQLCSTLNHVYSGLLPHDRYEPETFGMLFPTMQTVLPMESVRGIHYIFYVVFSKYNSLQTAVNSQSFKVNISRERFSNTLSFNLPDLILEPQLQVAEIMNEEGKSGDITIPSIQEEAMGVVYSKAMELYDECFDWRETYEDAMAHLVDLRDAIKMNIIETGMQMQRAIMSTGLKYGRRTYRGTAGWLDFSQQLVREVSELDAPTSEDLACEGLDILPRIETHHQEISSSLADYGIPQLDDRTPMLRHRLVVIVAKENTGKTQVVTHLIASLIMQGVKPYLACGETQTESMFMRIVSSYIYQRYGQYFGADCLDGAGFEELDDEDKQIVRSAKAKVASSGLILSNSLEYDNVLPTFTDAYRRGCEAFFVDHTQTLRGRKGRKISELVTMLALDCREFKREYPVYVCLTSQPSTNLKDILQKDQTKDIQQSPTAQSSTPSQEADELFILNSNDYYAKQNILQWIVFKRRDAPKPFPFFVKKLFHVASYQYDPNIQGGDSLNDDELGGFIQTVSTNLDDYSGYDKDDIDDLQPDFDS